MKIEYIKLKNFSNISSSFKSDEIFIDFRKTKNKIILLTGPNGSGKTSILSCLHPFATNGNLDIRNDNPLVLLGKEGYKEIGILDSENEYIIKHFYNPNKESHSIKSYIEKNGEELNPNGNVSSFKELIHNELDIEMDYLKLTRLGSNVTNFIDLKTTDRKSFMGKILDEVEIYLKLHKKVTNDMREIKSIISHLVDKISKLSINNEDDVKKSQKKLKKEIEILKNTVDELNGKLSIIQYEFDKYDSPILVKEELDKSKKEMIKIDKVLNKTESQSMSVDSCKNELEIVEKTMIQKKTQLESEKSKRSELLNSYDKAINEFHDVEREIAKIANSSELKELEVMISELKNTIQTRSKECNLSKYEYNATKKELSNLIIDLDKCTDMTNSMYEFGIEPIKKAFQYINTGTDISKYVESNKAKSEKDKLQNAIELVYNYFIKKINPTKKEKDNADKCCTKCIANKMYNEFMDILIEEPDIIIEDETFVTYTKMSYQTIIMIIDILNNQKDVIKKLSNEIQEEFTLKTLYHNIINMKPIYPKEKLYFELSMATDYEIQEEDIKSLNNLNTQFKLIQKSIGNTSYLESRQLTLQSDIKSIKDNVSETSENIKDLNHDILDIYDKIHSLKELKDSIEKRDSVIEKIENLESAYKKLQNLSLMKKEKQENYQYALYQYNKAEKEYNDINYKLESYKSLNKELSKYNNIYDEMELVKSALSSKEGIPLLYIQIYLQNIQKITNELLEIIYEDSLYIEDFNITADEFKIPYVTKDVEIKDVSYASQGEKSFISLALSFALIYQSISKYNIMLLDEIDATLDTKNREKFLQILEKQMNMIDGEQIFVISHNNMFNMYPVDIIDTKNKIDSNNKLAHYIKIDIK